MEDFQSFVVLLHSVQMGLLLTILNVQDLVLGEDQFVVMERLSHFALMEPPQGGAGEGMVGDRETPSLSINRCQYLHTRKIRSTIYSDNITL